MLKITADTDITLVYEKQIPASPKILIDSLTVILSTQNSMDAIENEMMDAIGSMEDWLHISTTDSFAFDAGTRLLKSISFYYPELNMVPANLHLLATAEKTKGIPLLSDGTDSFEVDPFPYRHYHMEGNMLLCFGDSFLLADQLYEVAISNELSLFFSNGSYCAWAVYHPEIFLTDHIAETIVSPSDVFLKTAFRDAFELITDETVEKMDEHNGDSLQQIAELHNRIATHGAAEDSPLAALKDWLFHLADKFYPEKELEGLFLK
jgi:hypothetical protein